MTKSWINYRTAAPSLMDPHLVLQGGSKKEGEAESQSTGKSKGHLCENTSESYACLDIVIIHCTF